MIHGARRIHRRQIALAALLLTACSGTDQPPPDGRPEGAFARLELEVAYPEAFSFLNSVRERADGTLLAADPLSQVLLHVDLEAGTADTLGRVGEGPEEYKQPDQVFPLPGDSTLLVDIGKTQFTIIDPENGLHSDMKMASFPEEGRIELILPRFVDDAGWIYHTTNRGFQDGPADSTELARYNRATETLEGIGWTWHPEPIVERSGQSVRMSSPQMEGRDDWAVGPQGQLAIVRANGYVVEWHYPDGRVVTGPPNPMQTPAITEEDKEAYLEQRGSDGLMTMISTSSSGAVEMSMSRGAGGMRFETPGIGEFQWAERYAPFRPDRALVSPTGQLWVERWLPPGQSPVLDVFDGEGVKLGTVTLPPDRRIIGFGSTAAGYPALYLVRTDEYDLKWLERYRLVR